MHTPLPKTSLGDADEFGCTAEAVRIVGVSYLLSPVFVEAGMCKRDTVAEVLVIVGFYAGFVDLSC